MGCGTGVLTSLTKEERATTIRATAAPMNKAPAAIRLSGANILALRGKTCGMTARTIALGRAAAKSGWPARRPSGRMAQSLARRQYAGGETPINVTPAGSGWISDFR